MENLKLNLKITKTIFIFLFVASIFLLLSLNTKVLANTSNYHPTSGTDYSGFVYSLLFTDLLKVAQSDDYRYTEQYIWNEGNYNDAKYIEFVFSPNIPSKRVYIPSIRISKIDCNVPGIFFNFFVAK